MDADLGSELPRYDYVSPGLTIVRPDAAFPEMIVGDTQVQRWRWLRRWVEHNWYTDRRNPKVGFASRDEAAILYNAARLVRGKPCLEIGTWRGWSAVHLALGSGMLDVVDPIMADPEFADSVRRSCDAAGVLDAIIFHTGFSPAAVDALGSGSGKKWSLIFVDGDHEGDAPRLDAEAAMRHAADTAMVLFHDLASPHVAAGLDTMRNAGWRTMVYQTMQIMGVAWRGSIEPPTHTPDPNVFWTLPRHLAGYHVSEWKRPTIRADGSWWAGMTIADRRDSAMMRAQSAEDDATACLADADVMRRDIAQRDARIAGLGEQIAARQAEVAQRDAQIAGLGKQIAAQQAEVAQRDAQIAGLGKQIAAQQAEVAQRDARIAGLDKQITAQHSEIATLKQLHAEALRAKQEDVSRLSFEVQSWRHRVDDLQLAISALQGVTSSWSVRLLRLLKQRLKLGGAAGRAPRSLSAMRVPTHSRAARLLKRHRIRRLVLRSGMFDAEFYLRSYPDVAEARVDPLNHYIVHGAADGRNPSPLFDTVAYLQQNPDVAASNINPLVHYLLHGAAEGRLLRRSTSDAPDLTRWNALVACSDMFDADFYLQSYPDVAEARVDPLNHYLTQGAAEGRNPSPLFDTVAYLQQNPDVAASNINPLVHYLLHGAAEGRLPRWSTWNALTACGAVIPWRQGSSVLSRSSIWISARPKIIFVSHEASRTGAPLILLSLIASFAKSLSYELLILCDAPGPLLEEFAQHGHVIDVSRRNLFSDDIPTLGSLVEELGNDPPILAICNTANTNRYAQVFKSFDIPVLTLIHEMADPYSAAHFRQIYEASDTVVFPARFVQAAAHRKAPLPEGKAAVIPQGLLDPDFGHGNRDAARRMVRCEMGIPEGSFLVLACGTISLRKGVDLFVSVAHAVARRTSEPIHFAWLGSDVSEAGTASCMRGDISNLGLDDRVHLIGEREAPAPYFLAADLFVLTSRQDPFPCVVHEAMAAGVPVIAFREAGGAPEALADGGGVTVGYRDVDGMAEAVLDLYRDGIVRSQLAETAKITVSTKYRFEDYYRAIVRLARDNLDIPLVVEGTRVKRDPATPKVFFFNRDWWISGVNSFTETLIQGLQDLNIDAELVFPELSKKDQLHLPHLPLRFLHLEGFAWPAQWRALIDFAERNAPCILVPNYDYATSAICPALSSSVGVIGIVHSDDIEHYDHACRLGRYWNRIICSTQYLADKVVALNPSFAARTDVIPYGISTFATERMNEPRRADEPISLVYCARLIQRQKRVLDLVEITKALQAKGVPYRLTVIGEGGEFETLQEAWHDQIRDGIVSMTGRLSRNDMLDVFFQSEVFLLVSEFEGMPISLLEAMGQRCVPIVTDIPCGIPELVIDGVTGYRVGVGQIFDFVERIGRLQKEPELGRRLSGSAFEHVYNGGFRSTDMAVKYAATIRGVWQDLLAGEYKRPASIVWGSPVENISVPGFLIRV
jgi:glycosyltransferase involved in cell wall biosynthesis/predicted O-methyltransferase YrrM